MFVLASIAAAVSGGAALALLLLERARALSSHTADGPASSEEEPSLQRSILSWRRGADREGMWRRREKARVGVCS